MQVQITSRILLTVARACANQYYPYLKLSKCPSKICEVAKILLRQQYPHITRKQTKKLLGAELDTYLWQGVLLNFIQNKGKIIKPIIPLKISNHPLVDIPDEIWSLTTLEKEPDGTVTKKKRTDTYTQKKAMALYRSREWRTLRYEILRDQNGCCQLCGRSRKDGVVLHVDHIVPLSKDWTKRLDKNNLQVLCEDCNLGKSNTDEIDWR